MSAASKERVRLNNGVEMPWLGLGVYELEDGPEVERAVRCALETGYRSIDTATIYRNERGVGKAIRQSGIPREEVFLTTKVWNDAQREGRALEAFRASLQRLGTEYVDLYLVHWPVAGCYKKTWKVLERIYENGEARAIGVSNFTVQHLDDLLGDCRVVPAVNQVEFHPRLFQGDLLDYCRGHGIRLEAWSPLMQGQVASEPEIGRLAEKHSRTPAQVVLRWNLQHGVVTIPKSGNPARIAENARIFDFELSDDDMRALDALDEGRRLGPDPMSFDF
jgi:diketogulonate reductase-like aldo/keto reductase